MQIPTDWTFKSASVAEGFDRHVREQLPWYDLATGAVAHIARHYIPEGGLVYDIGASTGNVGESIRDVIEKRSAEFVAIDSSPDMAKRYAGPGEFVVADALDFAFERFDVAVCFLVLMFLPPERRGAWLSSMAGKIKPGGAMIVFDKIEGPSGYLATVLHRLTIAGKVSSGVPPADIIAKELSLSGVQRPLPPGFIEAASANAVEVFRFGEFAGWVIEAPE